MMKNFRLLVPLFLAILPILFSCGAKSPWESPSRIATEFGLEADSIRLKIYAMSYSERSGEKLFKDNCVVCHGTEGRGDGFNSYNLNPRPRDLADTLYMNTISDKRLAEIIAQGGRGTGKSVLMPAYEFTLSDPEITDLVNYIRYLGKQINE